MENSKSENEESKIQISGSKNKSSEKKKKPGMPEHIHNLWDDHHQKLLNVRFLYVYKYKRTKNSKYKIIPIVPVLYKT